jgi:uncharacterized protein YbjT (DUF2867 family)
MKIAVTTPTGNIGRQLAGHLVAAGAETVLLARDRSRVKAFENRGAAAVEGSLADRDYVIRATQGADAVFWLTPPDFAATDHRAYQRQLGENASAAIKANSIPRVVHLSSAGAQMESGAGPVSGLGEIEKTLNQVASNISHLRPAFFMENLLSQVDAIKNTGGMYFPVPGDWATPMIATRDIADFAAKRLLDSSWTGQSIHGLHGPADLTLNNAAAIIGEAVGTPVRYVQVPIDETRKALLGSGMSEDVADQMIELYSSWANGTFRSAEPRTGETTTPTTLAEFAREVMKPLVAGALTR